VTSGGPRVPIVGDGRAWHTQREFGVETVLEHGKSFGAECRDDRVELRDVDIGERGTTPLSQRSAKMARGIRRKSRLRSLPARGRGALRRCGAENVRIAREPERPEPVRAVPAGGR
jgi:hypothetical protein